MSNFKIIVPSELTNLCKNPSFEKDTTGWTGSSATIARSAVDQRWGVYSGLHTASISGSNALVGYAYAPSGGIAAGITFSAMLSVAGTALSDGKDLTVTLVEIDTGISESNIASQMQTLTNGTKTEYQITGTTTGGSIDKVALRSVVSSWVIGDTAHIDGAVIIQGDISGEEHTYVDGDQPGCWWKGPRHASESFRPASTRLGGKVLDLQDDLGFTVSVVNSHGPTSQDYGTYRLGAEDGEIPQNVIKQPIVIDLVSTVTGTSFANLHSKRNLLLDYISPERGGKLEPFILRYTGRGTTDDTDVELKCYYAGGLGGELKGVPNERMALRFIAYDPHWYDRFDTVTTLSPTNVNDNGLIRNPDGWVNPGFGSGDDINDIAVGPDGTVYFGGALAPTGAIAGITKWDGSSLSDVGGVIAGSGAEVWGVATTREGDVIVTGDFLTAGGVAATNAALYDVSAATWSALSSGLAGGVGKSVAVNEDNLAMFVGAFTSAGGTAATFMATYDLVAATWAALSTGAGTALEVVELDNNDQDFLLGGNFTTIAGQSINRVAKYTPSTATFSNMGTGASGVVRAIDVNRQGDIYIGGDFATFNGVTVNKVVKWNGTAASAMGSGVSGGDVYDLFWENGQGELWIVGDFTTATTRTGRKCQILSGETQLGIVKWSGNEYAYPDARCTDGRAIEGRDGKMYIGADASSVHNNGAVTVTNTSNAISYPKFVIDNAGIYRYITNFTTGASISTQEKNVANANLTYGRVEYNFDPTNRGVTSETHGDITKDIQSGSDMSLFHLVPGENKISPQQDTSYIVYRNRYRSMD